MEFEDTAPAEPIDVAEAAPETPVEAPQEAPEASEAPEATTTRSAIEKAFERVDADEEAPAAKEAEAEPKASGPARGADGKFVAKDAPKEPEAAKEAETPPETDAKDARSPAVRPPNEFSAEARKAWSAAPESVRQDIHRVMGEMQANAQKTSAVLGQFEPFIKMAGSPEGTVAAMSRYVNTENTLRQNPVQGFTEIARNLGLSPQQVGKMLMGEAPGQTDPRDGEIMQLRQVVQNLQAQTGQINQSMAQQQQSATQTQVEQFAAAKPRFDELSSEIATMLETGYAKDLQDAYDKADRLHPVAQAAVATPPPAPAQPANPRPSRSVKGAPAAGATPASFHPSKTSREALERAIERTGL